MSKLTKNDYGVSLIWVLILLLVVGGLSAALLSSAVFNINFGSDEVNTSRAFYAAEAGVERTKADMFSSDDFTPEGYYTSGTLNYDSNFLFSYEVSYDSNNNEFEAIGFRGDIDTPEDERKNVQRIKFNLITEGQLSDIAVLLNKYGASDDIDDYVDFRGQEKDFGRDNIGLVDMGEWRDFLFIYYGVYLDGEAGVRFYENKEDVSEYDSDFLGQFDFDAYDEYDDWEAWKADEDKWDFDGLGDWEIKDMSRINQPSIDNKYWYLTNDRVKVGEGAENWDDLEKDNIINGDIVYIYDENEDIYYYYQYVYDGENGEIPKPGEGDNWQEYWEFLGEFGGDSDDNLDFGGNVTIEDSILVIDGSTKMLGNVTLINSLILVKNDIEFGGSYDIDESLILSFNEEGESLVTTGNPSIDLTLLNLSDELWPGIEGLLEKLDSIDIEFALINWRQVR